MLKAAALWATARRDGVKTADDRELDCDVILAAQALSMDEAESLVIATTNVRHLSRFADARIWQDI